MDALTHVFLPLTAAYVLKPEAFASPARLTVAGFGLFPDADKFLGQPGLLHSLVTLGPLVAGLFVVERWLTGGSTVSLLAAAFLGSHLALDVLDGGPVPLLFPFIERGVGLGFPDSAAFGEGPLGVTIHGPLVTGQIPTPQPGFYSYGFLTGFGIAGALRFTTVFFGLRRRAREVLE